MRVVRSRSLQVLTAGIAAIGSIMITTASAQGAVLTPAKGTPALSHQLCYTSAAKGFGKVPKVAEFADFFNPKGLIPKIGKAVQTCNPVRVVPRKGKAAKVTDAVGHLACFAIRTAHENLPAIKVRDQFGQATIHVGQPKQVCLPTWQSSRKAPKAKSAQPPGLDHFTCYGITRTTGRFRPGHLRVKDSFAAKLHAARIKADPTMVCSTALMIVGSRFSKVLHPGAFLICYPAGQTPRKRTVFALNQFGRATVAIHKTNVLCVPSRRR